MAFELPNLPFSKEALIPALSKETFDYHHDKHHAAYIKKLNALVEGSDYVDKDLETLIKESAGGIFNNAAQAWNHDFYWHCLSPTATSPSDTLLKAITAKFGSMEKFKDTFINETGTLFGSGWSWLTMNDSGELAIEKTSNADNPIRDGRAPLLTCDMWEHAYYIDYRNDKMAYLEAFWSKLNWKFISDNFSYSNDKLVRLGTVCKDDSPVCNYLDAIHTQETPQT